MILPEIKDIFAIPNGLLWHKEFYVLMFILHIYVLH